MASANPKLLFDPDGGVFSKCSAFQSSLEHYLSEWFGAPDQHELIDSDVVYRTFWGVLDGGEVLGRRITS